MRVASSQFSLKPLIREEEFWRRLEGLAAKAARKKAQVLLLPEYFSLGLAAFRHGRRAEKPLTKWIGVALMLYPYVVTDTAWMYAVGVALCVGLWFDRA